MRDGIIYDCPNANCRTPIHTGKCSKACIEKYNKDNGIKPQTNADRIRAMSDEGLAEFLYSCEFCDICEEGCDSCTYNGDCKRRLAEWLKQPAEE